MCLCLSDREDVQVFGPVAHRGVHAHVLQRQTHRLAAGPHHVGQGVQPREGRGEDLTLSSCYETCLDQLLGCCVVVRCVNKADVFVSVRNTVTDRKPT